MFNSLHILFPISFIKRHPGVKTIQPDVNDSSKRIILLSSSLTVNILPLSVQSLVASGRVEVMPEYITLQLIMTCCHMVSEYGLLKCTLYQRRIATCNYEGYTIVLEAVLIEEHHVEVIAVSVF